MSMSYRGQLPGIDEGAATHLFTYPSLFLPLSEDRQALSVALLLQLFTNSGHPPCAVVLFDDGLMLGDDVGYLLE
jgi:hypothetical protein